MPLFFLFYIKWIPISGQIARVEMPFCFICSLANSAKLQLYIFNKSDAFVPNPQQKWIYVNMCKGKHNISVRESMLLVQLWPLKHKNTEWSTVIMINSSICRIVSGEKPSLKTAQRGSEESLVSCRLYGKMLRLYTALTLQSVASLLMKAQGFFCYNWVLTGVNQRDTAKNKYVNKKCVSDSKGWREGAPFITFQKWLPRDNTPKAEMELLLPSKWISGRSGICNPDFQSPNSHLLITRLHWGVILLTGYLTLCSLSPNH